jgi:hypothetical protein
MNLSDITSYLSSGNSQLVSCIENCINIDSDTKIITYLNERGKGSADLYSKNCKIWRLKGASTTIHKDLT